MFGGSPDSTGFLDIAWANMVSRAGGGGRGANKSALFMAGVRGGAPGRPLLHPRRHPRQDGPGGHPKATPHYLHMHDPGSKPKLMEVSSSSFQFQLFAPIYVNFRFDTLNTSGIWNLSPKPSEIIVIAHE